MVLWQGMSCLQSFFGLCSQTQLLYSQTKFFISLRDCTRVPELDSYEVCPLWPINDHYSYWLASTALLALGNDAANDHRAACIPNQRPIHLFGQLRRDWLEIPKEQSALWVLEIILPFRFWNLYSELTNKPRHSLPLWSIIIYFNGLIWQIRVKLQWTF